MPMRARPLLAVLVLLLLAAAWRAQGAAGSDGLDADVIIIGLGPVGSFLAHLLASYGIPRVLGFEKSSSVYWAPRAVAWDDYTVRTSRTIGEDMEAWMRWHVRSLADQWSYTCLGLKSGDPEHRRGACDTWDANWVWRTRGMFSTRPPFVQFHQPSWERWMRRGLSNLSAVSARFGFNVLNVSMFDGDSCEVKVQRVVEEGAEEAEVETYRARYCVATDGGASVTRRQLGLRYDGKTFPDQPWVVVDTEVHDEEYLRKSWIDKDGSGFVMNPKCPFVFVVTPAFFEKWWEEAEAEASEALRDPSLAESTNFAALRAEALRRKAASLPGYRTQEFGSPNLTSSTGASPDELLLPLGTAFRFEFLVPPNMSEAEATSERNVAQLLRTCAQVDPDRLEIRRSVVYTFHARRAEKWRVGPVFLAGDAAHCMPPYQGQGMNSGIRDAANLAWKLSLVLRGYAGESILSSYEPERRSNLKQVTADSIKLGRMVIQPNPLKAYLRDTFLSWSLWLLSAVPSIGYGLQYRVLSRPSHIISEESILAEGEGQEVAGSLLPCPDVGISGPPAQEVPLDTLIAPTGFTLVFCAGGGADAQRAVLSGSDGSLAFLRRLGAWATAVAPYESGGSSAGEADKPVVEGLATGGRCRDLHGAWTAWVQRYGLRGRILLVRPDRYVFGAFNDVDSAAQHLARSLRTPAEVGPESGAASGEASSSATAEL